MIIATPCAFLTVIALVAACLFSSVAAQPAVLPGSVPSNSLCIGQGRGSCQLALYSIVSPSLNFGRPSDTFTRGAVIYDNACKVIGTGEGSKGGINSQLPLVVVIDQVFYTLGDGPITVSFRYGGYANQGRGCFATEGKTSILSLSTWKAVRCAFDC